MCEQIHSIPNKYSLSQLRRYCHKFFRELIQSFGIKRNVHLKSIVLPFSLLNGFTLSLGRKKKSVDIILINLWPYRHSAKNSSTMQFFYLYSTIAHELKHVKILQDWYDGITHEFGVFFSQWSYKHICKGFLAEHLARYYLLFKGASALKRKRYAVSPIELICYEFGFKESYKRFAHLLNTHENEIAQTIINSIEFINHHIEIDYFSSKQPYNRFTHTLYYLSRSLRRKPNKLNDSPQLLHIFATNGLMKDPVQLFIDRADGNARLIDQILVRMFITLSFDWETIFKQCPALHNHICTLSNNYCDDAIYFLKNLQLGEVFLSQSVLQDNAAMLIKNVTTLNKLMEEHHIHRTTGSLIPLFYTDDFTQGNNPHKHFVNG